MIPYSKQAISEEDIKAVSDMLRSEWLTQGPSVDKFENSVASICGKELLGTAFNSATSALHAACKALELGEGDVLWTVPNSFVASANCAIYCGAKVDFVDIDTNSWNMCPKHLKQKLEEADKTGKLPKIIVPVHFAGLSADMLQIQSLAIHYNIKIIEDASHALGARYNGHSVGCCHFSDITIFSFHPVKMITTGEGGMAMTKNVNLDHKMKIFRNHGITRNREKFKNTDSGPWSYQQIGLGYNYRMTDIAATLGLSQLKSLEYFVSQRSKHASHYQNKLKKLPYSIQQTSTKHNSSWHLFVVCLPNTQQNRMNREMIYGFMRDRGVGVNVHYEPIHLQPFYKENGFKNGMFPLAENYADRCLSIPIFPSMTNEEQETVLQGLLDSLELLN